MTNAKRTVRLTLFSLALAGCVFAAGAGGGCRQEPPPEPVDVPPPPEPAPLPPGRVPSALLDDVVEDAAVHLAQTLSNLPEVRSAKRKQVLALAPLKPAGRVSDERFASAVQSLHSRLQSMRELGDNFAFVNTSVEDARDLLARESDPTGFIDPLDAGTPQSAGQPARYAPNSIYVLTGRYSQSGRSSDGDVRYRLLVEVQHPADRKLVTSKQFQSALAWNEDTGEWVVAED